MMKKKNTLLSICIFTSIATISMLPFILGWKPFWLLNDQALQYDIFYTEWIRLLDNFFNKGVLPFYSFNTFLGNSFFASKSYYVVGDVFIWLVQLFPTVKQGLLAESIVVLALTGFFFSLFLKAFGIKNNKTVIWASCIYMLSGTATIYIGQYMFLRFFCFFPLLLYGIEKYRESNKRLPVALSTFLLFITSYYFSFPACLFLVLYVPFTWVYHNNSFKLIKIIKFGLQIILFMIIGACLAGLILIPTIYFIANNQRLGSYDFMLLFNPEVYFGYFLTYISGPFNIYAGIPYLFTVDGNAGHLIGYSLYTSVITLPCILSFFFKKGKDLKDKAIIITVAILMVSAWIPSITSLWHGLSEASLRWTFVCTAFNLLIIAIVFEDSIKNNVLNKPTITTLIISFVCLIGCLIIGKGVEEYYIHYIYILGCLAVLALYIFLLNKGKKTIVMVFIIFEMLFSQLAYSIMLSNTHFNYNSSIEGNYIQYIQDNDEDLFYRIYINPTDLAPYTDLNLNQGANVGYKSTMTYDSTYESTLYEFLKLNGLNWHIINIKNMEELKMLGVKYYYVVDESELPKGYSFTYFTDVNHFKVYQLDDYRPIGFTYSKFRAYDDVSAEEIANANLDWNNVLFVSDDLLKDVKDIQPAASSNFDLLKYEDETYFYGSVSVDSKQMLFLSIPYSSGWKVYDENYNEIPTYSVQGGFLGVMLEPGEHLLTIMYFVPGLTIGGVLSAIGVLGVAVLLYFDLKKSKSKSNVINKTE